MKIRNTASVRRGLREIIPLAEGDVEACSHDDPPRWNAKQMRDIDRAFAWLWQQAKETQDGR